MGNDQFKLPENAHRELKPGEEYEPILSKNKKYQPADDHPIFGCRRLPRPEGRTGV